MLVTAAFGTVNTGLSVYYQILNADKTVFLARTNSGVTEIVAGSGLYGVQIADASLIGRTVVWDIDGTGKTCSETFSDIPPVEAAVNDASATTTVFITTLTSAVTDFHKGSYLLFTSGSLAGQARSISAYNGTTKAVTLGAALTSAPANNDRFIILGRSGT
jgi:hypothetical protein